MAAQVFVALLATVVAVQYAFIGLYIVPRLARLAEEPGRVIRTGQWGAALFFVGCGITHVGIAVHTLLEPNPVSSHLVLVHVGPHLAQVLGGLTFSYIAWRKLDVRFSPKGYEEARRRAETERERSAALLAQRAKEQRAVAELGRLALQTSDPYRLMGDTVKAVADTLDLDYCAVLELAPLGDAVCMTAGVGWQDGVVGHASVPTGARSPAGLAIETDEAVVVDDLGTDHRFDAHGLLHDHGVVSGITVAIGGREPRFGVLGVYATSPRSFGQHDISFLKAVANVLATAIERAAADAESRHRALHDPLTGLPNRTLFLDRLEQALAKIARQPGMVGVLFFDLDNFKAVNDTFGHPAGDEMLAAVATRLQGVLRSSDTLARFGGDEFAVLCESLSGEREAATVAERIASALEGPIALDGTEHFATASIGIALADSPDARPEAMLRDADIAMYRAKERGRARFELFDEGLRERTLERMRIENALRSAVDRGEMRLAYQPLVSLADGSISGVEALLRWQPGGSGPVSPAEFIPVAEQSGLIVEIGTWVLQEACRQAGRWQEAHPHLPRLKVSVNVSAHQLGQPQFVETVGNSLAEARIDARQLALEITETVLMQAVDSPMATLRNLRELGVDVVLDDFGTGYSSLSYVERFPLSALKVDRAFVAALGASASSPAILGAVVAMASALELPVVAEGVETEDQVARIQSLGCSMAQGYYFARPMAPADVVRLVRSGVPPRAAAA